MAILEILTAPDPRLTMKSLPVEKVDTSVRKLMDNLLETLYDNNGVGIAAVQTGIHQQEAREDTCTVLGQHSNLSTTAR